MVLLRSAEIKRKTLVFCNKPNPPKRTRDLAPKANAAAIAMHWGAWGYVNGGVAHQWGGVCVSGGRVLLFCPELQICVWCEQSFSLP